jgi:hypothetical protein
MQKHCQNREVMFVNLGPVIEKCWRSGTQVTFGEDPHYSATAHRIIAQYLFSSFDKASFLTEGHLR